MGSLPTSFIPRIFFLLDKYGVSFLDVLSAADAPRLYAWALLSNHFHLLIQPFASDLSTMMRRLLTGHGMCGEGDFF